VDTRAIVFDEAHFLKFIHEKTDASARGSDNSRQSLLRHLANDFLRLVFVPVASKEKESASQPFFTGVEKLIDQILLDTDVPGKHLRHETIRQFMVSVKRAEHLSFFNNE
jgi:hypothetical protein